MAGWIVVKMSDEDIARYQAFRLQGQFEAIFMTALAPRDAAMFGNKDPRRDNHLFYFSPKAAEIFGGLLGAFSPQPCEAPARDSVALLIGHQNAFDMLPK